MEVDVDADMEIEPKKFECGPGTIAGCPSSLGVGVGEWSYSSFLASICKSHGQDSL